MYLLIPSLPLIGSITAGFFGRYIGRPGAKLVTTGLSRNLSIVFLDCILRGRALEVPCTLTS